MTPLTFYDLLGVISEELTERRPLWPLQSVKQLLDLCGHSAAHRYSYMQDDGGEAWQQDKHGVTLRFVHSVTFTSSHHAALHPRTRKFNISGIRLQLVFTFVGVRSSICRWQQHEEKQGENWGKRLVVFVGLGPCEDSFYVWMLLW